MEKKSCSEYTIKELKKIASERNIKNRSKLTTKKDLCEILNINYDETPRSPRRKSLPSPTAKKIYRYTKAEILSMLNDLGYDVNEYKKQTIPELCSFLELDCEMKKNETKVQKTKEEVRKILVAKSIKKDNDFKKKIRESLKNKVEHPKKKEIIKRQSSKRHSNILDLYDEMLEKKEKVRLSKNCILRSRTPLKQHQIEVIEFSKARRGVIVSHEVGSGKTLAAVAAAECYLDGSSNRRLIVITPKSLKMNFNKNAKVNYGTKYDYDGDEDDLIKVLGDDVDRVMIFGTEEFYSSFKNVIDPKYLKTYFKNVMIIVDEAHNLRGQGKIFQTILNCCKWAEKIILLTGTLVYNDLYDVTSLFSLIKGEEPIGKQRFASFLNHEGKIINNIYTKRYFDCGVSIYNAEDCSDYPEKREIVENVVMSDEIYYSYRKVEFLSYKSELVRDEVGSMVFLSGLRTGIEKISYNDNTKFLRIKEILLNKYKTAEGEEKGKGRRVIKSIIFSEFKNKGVKYINNLFRGKEEMFKIRIYTGDTDIDERNEIVDDFNSDRFNILLLTKAGGEGLDLKGVRNVFILEGQWNMSTIEQVFARARRCKSHINLPYDERDVTLYHMIFTKPPFERRSLIADIYSLNDPIFNGKGDDREVFVNIKDRNKSADSRLLELCQEKQYYKDNFMKSLRIFSIENGHC